MLLADCKAAWMQKMRSNFLTGTVISVSHLWGLAQSLAILLLSWQLAALIDFSPLGEGGGIKVS